MNRGRIWMDEENSLALAPKNDHYAFQIGLFINGSLLVRSYTKSCIWNVSIDLMGFTQQTERNKNRLNTECAAHKEKNKIPQPNVWWLVSCNYSRVAEIILKLNEIISRKNSQKQNEKCTSIQLNKPICLSFVLFTRLNVWRSTHACLGSREIKSNQIIIRFSF